MTSVRFDSFRLTHLLEALGIEVQWPSEIVPGSNTLTFPTINMTPLSFTKTNGQK